MRRIETQEEKEKRQKRRTRVFGMIMLLIMVISTIGYAFITFQEDSNGSKKSAGQAQAQNFDSRWILDYNGQQMALSSSKESLANISTAIFLDINNYAGNPVYIDSGNSSIILYELASNLESYASKVLPACYGVCDLNLPEKNCSSFLIVYEKANENKVYQQENCVFIEGDVRAADAFLYKIFDTA
ncbi:MAG: hypothetical protein AABX07_03080 [Nanoarchaeota archaeon]